MVPSSEDLRFFACVWGLINFYACFRVRSKYFDRILACLSQAHIKVLFSEGQGRNLFVVVTYRRCRVGWPVKTMVSTIFTEGTADILASLAQAEERKGRAIIYPLPLNKEREQVATHALLTLTS